MMLFVSAFTLHQIDRLQSERKFFQEQTEIITIESLLQMGTLDMVNLLKRDLYGKNGQFNYTNGTVTYWIQTNSRDKVEVLLNVKTIQNRQRYVRLFFNKELGIVYELWEVTM
ncbi:competence type IV pilus minor pilin ComGG [Bacillus sp. FJAT-45350]|uniref:competence type IV pilus minor pilin ComGG n=1 Tax=Bacillus sp. FJAT-45350 TaxID=2011014 RepID=UPI000BB8167D|nr:competence type IV pilus minor pilin ComGG [Bacillus sp. FJAT-45350]